MTRKSGNRFSFREAHAQTLLELPVEDHAAWFCGMAIPMRRAERTSSNLSRLHGTMSVFSD